MTIQDAQIEAEDARDLESELLCMLDDWGWEEDDFPPIDATPLRVSFLEAAKFAPVQEKSRPHCGNPKQAEQGAA